MPNFFLPNHVADQILAEKAGFDEARRVGEFRRRLKAVDECLDVFLCERDDPDNELRGGYWYVYRRGDSGMTGCWEVQNPDGSYREPGEDVVAAFQQMDGESLDDVRYRREVRRRARERALERRQDEAAWRLRDEADYAFRVQHAFPSLPWKKD